MAETDYERIVPQSVRVAQASTRALEVIERRGSAEQIERVKQSYPGSTPPPANHPHWSLYAGEVIAVFGELMDAVLAQRESKRGRPPKNTEGGTS